MSVGTTGGSAIWNDLQVTLKDSGTDIWGTSDQFEYAHEDCFRDCTITARVASLQNTNTAGESRGDDSRVTIAQP